MDWSDLPPLSMLRAFEATARLGGFSSAGRELNVTHAAVAQQVRGLERRLGLTLVRREGRGLVLTPAGARLGTRLGEGLTVMRDALAELTAESTARPVHVTMTPDFLANWLVPRLAEFSSAHPGVELMLNPSGSVVDLSRTDHDLAIRFASAAARWPGMVSDFLLRTRVVMVAAPALIAGLRIAAPADLLALPWVQEVGTAEWSHWLRAKGLDARGKTDVLHLPGPLALEQVRAGRAVGMVSELFVDADIRAGRLSALDDVTLVLARTDERRGAGERSGAAQPARPETDAMPGYHLLSRPGHQRAPVAAFAAWIRRAAEADQQSGRMSSGSSTILTP